MTCMLTEHLLCARPSVCDWDISPQWVQITAPEHLVSIATTVGRKEEAVTALAGIPCLRSLRVKI